VNITNVVAGVITKKNLFFIAQRNRNKHLGLKWEFPGGKVEKNETIEDALKREIKEELNIKIFVKKKIAEEKYKDETIDIILHYYFCKIIAGAISLNEHENSMWILKKHFYKYDMIEGDRNIIRFL
jgi:8-oxo-dGTP diphosphatase